MLLILTNNNNKLYAVKKISLSKYSFLIVIIIKQGLISGLDLIRVPF